MPRKAKPKDPADQILAPGESAAQDAPPKPKERKPKVTVAMAQGVVDAVQSLAMLVGHLPDEAEKKAATMGLLAACKRSTFLAKLISGGGSAGEYAVIVVGLGGLVARLASDVGALPRDQTYGLTGIGYQMIGAKDLDLSEIMAVSGGLETGRTPGDHRADGLGQDVPGPEDFAVPEVHPDAGDESRRS